MYTIHATRNIAVFIESPNACGTPGQRNFIVEIEVDVNNLDEKNKFICEVNALAGLMQKKYGQSKWRASCEQLAAAAVCEAYEFVTGRKANPDDDDRDNDYDMDDPVEIRTKITPVQGRFVKATWNEGEDLPVEDLPINIGQRFDSLEEVKRAGQARSAAPSAPSYHSPCA